MRQDKIWQDEAAIDEFLDNADVGHLASLGADGWPSVAPVNFLWRKGRIYFHSAVSGDKVANIRRDPKVSFIVTEALSLLTSEFTGSPCRSTQLGRSVLIRGLAAEIRDVEEKALILGKLAAKYENFGRPRDEELPEPNVEIETGHVFTECLVVEIKVERLTGYQELLTGKPQKYCIAVADHLQKVGRVRGDDRALKSAQTLLGLLR